MINTSVQDFRSAISLASMVPERRNTIPILSTLRCRANGALEVSGTDLDMTIKVAVPREAGDDAAFTLGDYQFVAKSLGANGGKALAIATGEGGALSFESGALEIKVKTSLPVDDWPADGGIVSEETFSASLSANHLRQLARVVPAISTEETRYYLNGIYLHHVEGWNYRAVATDGHRLIMVELALPDATGKLDGIIIPRKAVSVLLRALGKSSDPVRISGGHGTLRNSTTTTAPDRAGQPRVSFSGKVGRASITLSTKIIDGTFPDYSRVVPKANETRAVFGMADIRRAIEAVARTESRVRAIKLDFLPGSVRFTSKFAETGTDAGIDIPCQHNAADGFSIGFNGQYLMDLLGSLNGDEVAMDLADSAAPTLIRDPADTAFTSVLMPMRV